MDHADPTDPSAQARPEDERARVLEDEIDDARREVDHLEDRGADDTGTPERHRRFIDSGTEGTEYEDDAIAP